MLLHLVPTSALVILLSRRSDDEGMTRVIIRLSGKTVKLFKSRKLSEIIQDFCLLSGEHYKNNNMLLYSDSAAAHTLTHGY